MRVKKTSGLCNLSLAGRCKASHLCTVPPVLGSQTSSHAYHLPCFQNFPLFTSWTISTLQVSLVGVNGEKQVCATLSKAEVPLIAFFNEIKLLITEIGVFHNLLSTIIITTNVLIYSLCFYWWTQHSLVLGFSFGHAELGLVLGHQQAILHRGGGGELGWRSQQHNSNSSVLFCFCKGIFWHFQGDKRWPDFLWGDSQGLKGNLEQARGRSCQRGKSTLERRSVRSHGHSKPSSPKSSSDCEAYRNMR